MLYNKDFSGLNSSMSAELKRKPLTAIPALTTINKTRRSEPISVCSFHSVSPEDAPELNSLKESIAWPETPSVPSDFSLEDTSDPAHSTFTILPQNGGGSWHLGDQLKVLIKIADFHGHTRKSGGDLLYARLHNAALSAGVAGKVFDHCNGYYTAVFSLLWEGSAQVEVRLKCVSTSVAVMCLT